MLRELATDIYDDGIVMVNRYVEAALVFFNTIVSLMLLTSPWYIIENDTVFPPGSTCTITSGTVIVPFISEFCDKSLTTLPGDDGKDWKHLHAFVWVYFVLAIISSIIIIYELVQNGVRQWDNANTAGFSIQVVLIIFQSLILSYSNNALKPLQTDDSTARILTITAIVLSTLRAACLMFFMYITKKYNPRGRWGTGSAIRF